jgi:hypothetical protein
MDYHLTESYQCQTKESHSVISLNNDRKVDQQMFYQIESLIKQQFSIYAPALLFEYRTNNSQQNQDFSGWDHEDLNQFFSHFGDIDTLHIYGKIAIILFKTFIDALTAREFLLNSSNFKESEKDNFRIRWLSQDDEEIVTEPLKSKLKKYYPSIKEEISEFKKQSFNNSQKQFSDYYSGNNTNNNSSGNNFSNYYNNTNNNNMNYKDNNNNNNNQNRNYNSIYENDNNSQLMLSKNYSNNSNNNEDSTSDNCLHTGKYTCKYEIQIENDNEFQVARRLIGSKVKLLK